MAPEIVHHIGADAAVPRIECESLIKRGIQTLFGAVINIGASRKIVARIRRQPRRPGQSIALFDAGRHAARILRGEGSPVVV